jgi:protein TonB
MENKKSKKADINQNRLSFLLLGLVCSTSFTLMSFEFATFSSTNHLEGIESATDPYIEENFKVVTAYVPPKPKVQMEVDRSTVTVDPEPVPTPLPSPEPTPTPVDPYAGFEEPTVGEPIAVEPIIIDDIFEIVEVMPEFPGGLEEMYKFLGDNVNYPAISMDNDSQGTAYVKFVVEKNGEISDLQVVKGVDQYINKEALRVLAKMPNWKPGEQMGQNVRVSFVLPIKFKID